MVLLLLGTWEVGRLVQVYQILNSSVRESARIAAQGQIINLTGSYTQITVTPPSNPNVTDTVKNVLRAAGFNPATVTVSFTFLDPGGNPTSTPTQPWQGVKGQRFRVTASIPYDHATRTRWTDLNLLNVTQLQVTFDWVSLIDDPFTIKTELSNGDDGWTAY
jgi:hypothetical protein